MNGQILLINGQMPGMTDKIYERRREKQFRLTTWFEMEKKAVSPNNVFWEENSNKAGHTAELVAFCCSEAKTARKTR